MDRQGRFDSIEDVLVFNSKFHNRGNWFKFNGEFIYQNLIITNDSFEKPTQEFLESELKKQQDEFDANQYQRDRIYPEIGDQLDMIYWDKKNGTEKWKEMITKVKSDHPKPE